MHGLSGLETAGAAVTAAAAVWGVVRRIGGHGRRHVRRWAAIWALPERVDNLTGAVNDLSAELRGTRQALTARLAVDEDALYRRTPGGL